MRRRQSLIAIGTAWLWPCGVTLAQAAAPSPPALMLANRYHPGLDLNAYWVSEKLDGVRAFWDGQRLLSRGGLWIQAPAWFTEGWPVEPADGELWAGRGRFQQTVSAVRQQTPDDGAWRSIRFMVFDLPEHPADFTSRIAAYHAWVHARQQPWVQAVEQVRVSSHSELMQRLDTTVRAGGEGLMLHRGDTLYRAERSDDLVKLKRHEDAEAQVVAHEPGRGRYAGLTGALRVRTPDGREFRLGSGLSDTLRRSPPPLGAWVTYRYRGFNDSGLPRFATYLRVRGDMEPPPTPASR
jgi:DNA ligase-1